MKENYMEEICGIGVTFCVQITKSRDNGFQGFFSVVFRNTIYNFIGGCVYSRCQKFHVK